MNMNRVLVRCLCCKVVQRDQDGPLAKGEAITEGSLRYALGLFHACTNCGHAYATYEEP